MNVFRTNIMNNIGSSIGSSISNNMGFSNNRPKLIEPGVHGFLKENLRNCGVKKGVYMNKLYNLGLLILFLSIMFMILYYKYKGKLTHQEKKEKMERERLYIVNKVRSMNVEREKAQQKIITNLPLFNDDEHIKGVLPMTHPGELPANMDQHKYFR